MRIVKYVLTFFLIASSDILAIRSSQPDEIMIKEQTEKKIQFFSDFIQDASFPFFVAAAQSMFQSSEERSYIPFLCAATLYSVGHTYDKIQLKKHGFKGNPSGDVDSSLSEIALYVSQGLLGSCFMLPYSVALYPFHVLVALVFKSTGAKTSSALLLPFFGSNLLHSSSVKDMLFKGLIFGGSGVLTYSGIQDIIEYKKSNHENFVSFILEENK